MGHIVHIHQHQGSEVRLRKTEYLQGGKSWSLHGISDWKEAGKSSSLNALGRNLNPTTPFFIPKPDSAKSNHPFLEGNGEYLRHVFVRFFDEIH